MDEKNGAPKEMLKESKLPPHVQALMYGPKGRRPLPRLFMNPEGMLSTQTMLRTLNEPQKRPPWAPDLKIKGPTGQADWKPSSIQRTQKQKSSESLVESKTKQGSYDEMIKRSPYNKIAFVDTQVHRDVIPPWCQDRLRTACRSARFELPSDKTILKSITPLQFLAKYTRLYREQRRRYSLIFNKHKLKSNDYIEYQNLFPALNSMFGMFLSKKNFRILCTALLIDDQTVMDETTFIGVCTFTDRLFWTSYLDSLERNTFTFLGPNRSVLEYVDFEGLQRKIKGLSLPKEIYYLLYSLA